MKLLLDENLSRRIIPFLQTAFPGSSQVALLNMERALVSGHPPQVVWLKIPNRPKTVVLNILLDHHEEIKQALVQQNLACVEISPGRV